VCIGIQDDDDDNDDNDDNDNNHNGDSGDNDDNDDGDDPATQAFMQVIEVRSFSTLPRVYMVHPYAQLPDYSPPGVDIGLLPPLT
jgi:hypothetical protein